MTSAASALALSGVPWSAYQLVGAGSFHSALLQADAVIIGGGTGGCAAAMALYQAGLNVIMTEETDWIGGQFTQQGVPPDEHPWIESFGATESYMKLRASIRNLYKSNYPLTPEAHRSTRLNPGGCWVAHLCNEPRVAWHALDLLLAPARSQGSLSVLLHTKPVLASVDGHTIKGIWVEDTRTRERMELQAPFFIDGTETGELLPLTGTDYITGAESRAQTGELHAPESGAADNEQAITWCFAIDYQEDADHTIEKPAQYAYWREYVPPVVPAWPGKLLSLTYASPATLQPRTLPFDPRLGAQTDDLNWYTYRQIIDPSQFEPGAYTSGISLINWPQNDYLEGRLIDQSATDTAKHLEEARQLSLSLLYWLQTEAPRPDGGVGWKGLRPRGDLMGTADGLAKRPYIRESRRIKAHFTVTEQHIGTEARRMETVHADEHLQAARFPDSVGIGSYRIDLHPSTGGDNYIDISSLPFQIPLGALIPIETTNLIPACKNIGTTHITNGCYRLHPVEWNIGEVAGHLVAYCLDHKLQPVEVLAQNHLTDFQRRLTRAGIPLAWPDVVHTPR